MIDADKNHHWYLSGKRHREDGPAVIYPDGTQVWWQNNKLHREDGPAQIWADGTKEWWINGNKISDEDIIKMARAI